MSDDASFMDRALALARQADARVEPNPRVGAVVVRDGRVVGEGFHPRVGEPHAEVFALNAAGEAARGATLYVTLEPCRHHGRTPPCTDAVIAAGVTRVVVARRDPNPRVAGGGVEALRAHGLAVEVGVREEPATDLVAPFLKAIQSGLPWVSLKWAMSLDGKIAAHTGDSKWITSPEARESARRLRAQFGAIVVGAGTALRDDPSLTSADPSAFTPLRVVVDSAARLPLESNLARTARAHTVLVAVAPGAASERVAALEAAGCTVFQAPADARGRVELRTLLTHLVELGVHSVLVEGGSRLAASALEARLADEVRAYVAPALIGGSGAPTPVAGEGIADIAAALRGEWQEVERIGPDVFLRMRLRL